MLSNYGTAKHYHRLGYYLFQEADYSGAAELAEKGLELAQVSTDDSERDLIPRIRNNLAFYYAMLGRVEKREAALHYAMEAYQQYIREGAHAEAVASSLDTLGLVRITFAESRKDVEAGLENVEEARRLGGRPDMYFRHVELAARRMGEFAESDG